MVATRVSMVENSNDRDAETVRLISRGVSLNRLDGGGKRVAAFLGALHAGGIAVEVIGVGPSGTDEAHKVVSSPLHRFKRRLLPVPLRRRIESELAALTERGPTMSLVPSANRWALRTNPNWLDFPDLWSEVADNQAATVDRVSACFNKAQASMWRERERAECERADVVSVASWSDRAKLGEKAIWLPTPVAESAGVVRNHKVPFSPGPRLVYGLLAHFGYPPNRDAFQRLVRQWLPVLRPYGSRIVVAGFGSEDLPRVMDVEIIGAVDDVASFYERVDVVLAPIARGGGMKVKVVEAMMYGVPVVATQHAMEGLPRAIVDECIDWESYASGTAHPGVVARLRDPRENPAVADALHSFTFDSFRNTFARAWQDRMVTCNQAGERSKSGESTRPLDAGP